jgi:hypothetical protein
MQIYRNSKFHIRLLSFAKKCHVLWQKLINIKEEPALKQQICSKKTWPHIPKASNLQSPLQELEILRG